jgi:hypothetical protein
MTLPITEETAAPPPETETAPDEPLIVLIGAEDAETCTDGSCW